MLRNLFETIRRSSVQEEDGAAPCGLARSELLDLFRDDFAAQAVMIRSRKAMRASAMQMAA